MDLIATTTGSLICSSSSLTSCEVYDVEIISVISNAEFLFTGVAIIIFLLTIDIFIDLFNIKK